MKKEKSMFFVLSTLRTLSHDLQLSDPSSHEIEDFSLELVETLPNLNINGLHLLIDKFTQRLEFIDEDFQFLVRLLLSLLGSLLDLFVFLLTFLAVGLWRRVVGVCKFGSLLDEVCCSHLFVGDQLFDSGLELIPDEVLLEECNW
jgi:hypothetical protein